MHRCPAGLPPGIPGSGVEIEITVQQAAHPGRQSMARGTIRDAAGPCIVRHDYCRARRPVARAYLPHAAISPLSSRVLRARAAVIDGAEREGLGAMGFQLEQADRARELFAGLIGAEPEQVARLSSTSAGVSAISTALRLEPGDRIIVFEGEFPTNVTPWAASVRRAGAEQRDLGLTRLGALAALNDLDQANVSSSPEREK